LIITCMPRYILFPYTTLFRSVERLYADLFSIPWGHHRYIIDKCSDNSDKALFYVRQTLENGWSRDMLLNMLGTSLYERSGKAQTDRKSTRLNSSHVSISYAVF